MRFKKLFIILFIYFIAFINVNAATIKFEKNSISIKEGETSDVINVILTPKEEDDIHNVEFKLSNSSELITIKAADNTTGFAWAGKNDPYIVLDPTGEAKSKPLTGTIYSFVITNTSSEDATDSVSLTNVKIDGVDYTDEIKPLNITLKKQVTTTTRALNTSAKITGFTVANATIKPAFSKDIKEYKIYVSKDTIKQITIRPTYEQSGTEMDVNCTLGCTADKTVPNKLNLEIGKNEATFTFTSEDGKKQEEYKFIIYRGPTTDGSNLLADLKVTDNELNETFNKSNLDYTLTVKYEVEEIEVIATPEDENAKVEIKGNDKLEVGENVITITVTSAETLEKKIYNIKVTREEFVPEDTTTTDIVPIIEPTPKKNNLWIILLIAFISLLLIGLAAYFIFFKKSKDKPKKKTEQEEVSVKEKPSIIDEDKEPTSVDDALKDLMATREMEINE